MVVKRNTVFDESDYTEIYKLGSVNKGYIEGENLVDIHTKNINNKKISNIYNPSIIDIRKTIPSFVSTMNIQN